MEDLEFQRGQFTFYVSYYNAVSRLPKCRQLELFQAICRYALYGELPVLSGASAAVFDMIVPNLKASRVKAAARLKELEDVENSCFSVGENKEKKKNNIKYNNNEKEKNNDKYGAGAADPAFTAERVFDPVCKDDPMMSGKLREYARHRLQMGAPVTPKDAGRLYGQLMRFPKEERRAVVDQSIWFDLSEFRGLDYTYGPDRVDFCS